MATQAESLSMALDLANNPDAAEYLFSKLQKIMPDNHEILDTLEDYVQTIRQSTPTSEYAWSGQDMPSQTRTLNENIAGQSIDSLSSSFDDEFLDVRMDIAINEESEVLRGYDLNNQTASDEQIQALDGLFNAWLTRQNWLCKDGVIYQTNAQGKVLTENGKDIIASSSQFETLIKDEITGLNAYVSKKSPNIEIEVNQVDFPEPQKTNTVAPGQP